MKMNYKPTFNIFLSFVLVIVISLSSCKEAGKKKMVGTKTVAVKKDTKVKKSCCSSKPNRFTKN
jgi:hypothetical protein